MAVATPKVSEPRAHHFVPQCWLAGFTDVGRKDGRLFVTDLNRRKQWTTTPPNAGHRRDFYRVPNDIDPLAFEKHFAWIENWVAPLFRSYNDSPREVLGDDLDVLLLFAAVQFVRTPSFRPILLQVERSIITSEIAKATQSEAKWKETLRATGCENAEISREDIQTFKYLLSGETDYFLTRGFEVVDLVIYPSLSSRYWSTLYSPSGSFIGSDTPVVMDGPPNQMLGFKSAEVVMFTINRHLALYGTPVKIRRPLVNRKLIATHNTFAMLTAEEQVYSYNADFCWLDSKGKVQTQWESFSKVVDSIGNTPKFSLYAAE